MIVEQNGNQLMADAEKLETMRDQQHVSTNDL